jgi:RNA polymerase sigma factor (sigma-70 family)
MNRDLLAVVEKCKGGDEAAWDQLVFECEKIIRTYSIMKFRSAVADEIDEITQKVWVRLLRGGIANFRGRTQGQFLAYLRTITINVGNTHFARRNVVSETAQPEMVSADPDPEMEILFQRQIATLRECLKELPQKHQEIAWMKAKGYKDREIQEILGMPLGTVAVSYARLKAKLRDCMNGRQR